MRDKKFLAFVRSLPCCVTLRMDNVQAAHLRLGVPYHEKGGMGIKSHDKWSVPLSAEEHMRQHQIGEKSYWGDMSIPMGLSAKLYEIYYSFDLDEAKEKVIEEILRWNRVFQNRK